MFGVQSPEGDLLNTEWYVMTNDSYFAAHAALECDGSHRHREVNPEGLGSKTVEGTGFYSERLVRHLLKHWQNHDEQWMRRHYKLHYQQVVFAIDSGVSEDAAVPLEPAAGVTSDQKDRALAQLHRLHRAAGHPSNRALARLCKDRGMPRWMVDLAKTLQCQACVDTQRGEQMVIPYALGAKPAPWQIIALDTLELVFPTHRCKARFLIATCVVMKFTGITMVWKGSVGESGIDSGKHLAEAFCEMWLAHRPKPTWVTVDPQTSLSAGAFIDFLQMAGVGVSVTPGEAHWQHGSIEAMIRVIKDTMKKIRNEQPQIEPSTVAALAVNAHNSQYKVSGFSPVQWAYGYDPNPSMSQPLGPMEFNAHKPHAPFSFWETQRLRSDAEDVWRKTQAQAAWTRLTNAAPRKPREYQVGEWVCIWRKAIWRSRRQSVNPEPRFVGPGRVVMVEPAILAENKPMVYWVVMGTQVWRCAPEQLRKASEQEIVLEELADSGQPQDMKELLKKTSKVVDTTREGPFPMEEVGLPETPGSNGVGPTVDERTRAQPSRSWVEDQRALRDQWHERSMRALKKPRIDQEAWRWKQLVSVNENRRREGLPPVMELPEYPFEDADFAQRGTQFFAMDGPLDQPISEEAYEAVLQKIHELEEVAAATRERNLLREQIAEEKKREKELVQYVIHACENGEEACFVTWYIDNFRSFSETGQIYAKQMMASTKEIQFRNLTQEDKAKVEESMAREVNEVIRSKALKVVEDNIPEEDIRSRCIPMRWLLIWKPFDSYQDPKKEDQPGVISSDGMSKAKARIVMIGYKHPDLARRDEKTGKTLLQTSSPTLSRLGRNLFLQAVANDRHSLECADAKSAFLQTEIHEHKTRLYTQAVDEVAIAMGVKPGTALEVVGNIYGLTNAPRLFWLDADQKAQAIGGVPHGVDGCIWIFKDPATGRVVGRIAAHVDDFLIAGDSQSDAWLSIRDKIKHMYKWTPWKKGSFVFTGVMINQLQDYTIHLTQEHFCHELQPILIENERSRPKDDRMSQKELTQCRGLIMKCQWRALQSAPQYCCRIGLCASSASRGTIDVLKEANAIAKELKKTSLEGLIFHAFPDSRPWQDLVFLHFVDAARGNRHDGSDTGGFITGVTVPGILDGKEALLSVVDYKSWKLDRPVRGSNGSEAQALYVGEDLGWKARIVWALLHGENLIRGNADDLASKVTSLLITDSRGCYDALTNSESPLCGMNSAKTGVEIQAVQRGIREGSNCFLTWTPSDMNLSDVMTKVSVEAFRLWALWQTRKTWIVKFNDEFISARKQQRLRKQQGKPAHPMLDAHFEVEQMIEGDLDLEACPRTS